MVFNLFVCWLVSCLRVSKYGVGYHPQGVGDSGQGAANAVLFCLFTKIVRVKLKGVLFCKPCRRKGTLYQVAEPTKEEAEEEDLTHYDEDSFAENDCGNDKLLLDVGSFSYGTVK